MDDSYTETKSSCGRRLLSVSYRSFDPIDIGDRYVRFLLENELTLEKLTRCVISDHVQEDDNTNTTNNTRGDSIEVDAYHLIMLDPILGNLTLRYPDTLLPLLEDATVQAKRVLRRRMEVALKTGMERQSPTNLKAAKIEKNKQLLMALQRSSGINSRGDPVYQPHRLQARLVHLPPHHQCCKPTLSSINSSDVGTVVQVSGTCVRTGPVRMMETIRTYTCKDCGGQFEVLADFGTSNNALPAPIVCPFQRDELECNGTNFSLVESKSTHCDYQEIKVQESADALSRVGSAPRSLLIKLTNDLADKCNPGDEVVVVGSLHAEWQSGGGGGFGNNLEIMVGMSMKAHSVRVVNVDEEVTYFSGSALSGSAFGTTSGNLREIFRREFDAFWSEEAAKSHPIATRDFILRAVCPKLYGMHAVKLGLLLALIGGASVANQDDHVDLSEDLKRDCEPRQDSQIDQDREELCGPMAFSIDGNGNDSDSDDSLKKNTKQNSDESNKQNSRNQSGKGVKSRRRIQSHILLIGDPGTGKSQFLRFAAALSPRSVLTTGTGSSTAGLTCAAVKDSGNEFSLEAGALALADRGVCCIDEFGCMSKEDRASIHEAMEQQTISVAKAGIVAKLNARATVVAVMNPVGGIYDENISIERNSRLGSALLSRFDIIFIMMDQAEIERDDKIAHFLLQQSIQPGSGYDRPADLEKHLNDNDTNGHWGMEKLRAYVAIVRDKFHPTLTTEASQLLENHYDLCRQSKTEKSLPVTVRFLESLIRLSQAHARLMYRNEVLLDDAVAVILLMEHSATAYQDVQDDFKFVNPIDSDFPPFDRSDDDFKNAKEILLERYRNNGKRGGRQHPQTPGYQQRDQWTRRMMSQSELTQNPPSHELYEVRTAMTMMNPEYTPQSEYMPPTQTISGRGMQHSQTPGYQPRDQYGRQKFSQLESTQNPLSHGINEDKRQYILPSECMSHAQSTNNYTPAIQTDNNYRIVSMSSTHPQPHSNRTSLRKRRSPD
eukprot:scaffold64965_cov79-Cyclotella_meneghiniana.AAC.9